METKLKGNGDVSFCGVDGIITYVQEMEGEAVLLNNVWHSAVVNFGCVSSRILWIKFKFVWLWVTGPMREMVKKRIDSG